MKNKYRLDFVTSLVLVFGGSFLGFTEANRLRLVFSDFIPIKYLHADISNPLVFVFIEAAILVIALYFGNILIDFYKKSRATPFDLWGIYQGSIIGLIISISYWILLNQVSFQATFLFRLDFVIPPLLASGILLFLARKAPKPAEALNASHTDYFSEFPISDESQDMFGVAPVVDELHAAIENAYIIGLKIIALYGQNGIGKTSCINLALKKLNGTRVLTSFFEPYKYSSELEMTKAFYSSIVKPLDDRYILPRANSITKKLTSLTHGVTGITPVARIDMGKITESIIGTSDFDKLRGTIESYLKKLDKRLIIIVDDIDRCSIRKRHLFFQLVGTIKSFENILILVSASADELLGRS